ncbi:AraC-type DNA-binding protein [Dyadobacter soli]|uniref:AraC-type DNA-binding protein n=2 Tax=Dyadobacter soli TaxID=659014 RepID=A0A1G7MET0_9BACT|nr:AraC-type DNA-binding protein [Dyadobacter soli]
MISYAVYPNTAFRQSQTASCKSEHLEIYALNEAYFSNRPAIRKDQVVEIIWVRKGRLYIMHDLETYKAEAGTIVFLTRGQTFEIRSSEAILDGLVLRLSAGIMPVGSDLPYPNIVNSASRVFEIDNWTTSAVIRIVQLMRRELINAGGKQDEVLSGYLKIMLIYLFRRPSVTLRSSLRTDISVLARRFFDLLEQQYSVNKKVSEYADELAVSPNHLNQIIKQETGMSAGANIRKRLLVQAQRMANVHGISMKTVAYQLGFNDAAHFSKFFKIGCGCNFTDYRKRIMESA